MSEQTDTTLIQELRLRRWARANYVPADQRTDNHWHPVVLNEMERRDVEMKRTADMDEAILTQFVPLEPTISQLYPDGRLPGGRRIHNVHTEVRGPRFLRQRTEAPQKVTQYDAPAIDEDYPYYGS